MYFAISICYNPDVCKCCENGKFNKIYVRTRATRKENKNKEQERNKRNISEQEQGQGTKILGEVVE